MNIKHLSLCAGSCLPLLAGAAQGQVDKPNIVLILVDDLGWSDFGCYGSEIRTPTIDSLAENGLRYRQFYNAARSSPSRCALMTGLYTQQVAVDPSASLPNLRTNNNITIAELLQENGYRTYMAGKWHLGTTNNGRAPRNRGFQHVFGVGPLADGAGADFWDISLYGLQSQNNEITWDNYAGRRFHQTDAIGDYAVKFIRHSVGKNDDNPFFIYMPFNAPHFSISGPAEIADKYTDVADTHPEEENYYLYETGWDNAREYRFNRQKELGVINDNYELPPRSDAIIPANTPVPAWNTLDEKRRNDLSRRMAVYAAAITQIDDNIRKVVDELKATDQLDNTLIIIMSDNGGNYEGHLFGNPNARELKDLYNMGQANDQKSFPNVNLGGGWANVANAPFRLYKHFAHEGGIRSPGIFFYPGHISNPGSWVEQRAHLIDIMATIVDITGSTYPTNYNSHVVLPMEGQSLKPHFTGGTMPERSLFFEHESNRALFEGDYKLVTKNFTLSNGSSPAHQVELYNIIKDPCELHNLASEQTERVIDMVEKWNATAVRVGVPIDRLIKNITFDNELQLIFRFSFDDNLVDASPNAYELTPGNGNGTSIFPTVVKFDEGKFGNAILLDGQNDYYDLNAGDLLNPAESALTACAWVYNTQTPEQRSFTETGIDEEQVLHQLNGTTTGNGRVVLQHIINDTESNIGSWLAGAQYRSPVGNCFSLNEWQHICVAANPGNKTKTFFLNGQQLGEPVNVTTDFISINGGFRIGAHRSGIASFWHGKLDEVCLFKGILTPEQIVNVMNNNFDFLTSLPDIHTGSLRIFPNPASADLYIEGVDNFKTAVLLNMGGKTVLTSNQAHITGLSGIPAGIYILKVESVNELPFYQKVTLKHKNK